MINIIYKHKKKYIIMNNNEETTGLLSSVFKTLRFAGQEVWTGQPTFTALQLELKCKA